MAEEKEVVEVDGKPVSAEELADIVWLAAQIWDSWQGRELPAPARPEISAPVRPGPTTQAQAERAEREAPAPERGARAGERGDQREHAPLEEVVEEGKASIHLPDSQLGLPGESEVSLFVPAASALPQKLALARSLRPLMRRVNSVTEEELDEVASAERSAETDSLVVVLRPTRRRWFDLAVVVDESESMLMWHRTISEFLELLRRSGAFRNLAVYGLRQEAARHDNGGGEEAGAMATGERLADLLQPVAPPAAGGAPAAKGGVHLHITKGAGWVEGRQCAPRELIDPRGERMILVISDTAGEGWANGEIPTLLSLWAEKGPVSILHMLPRTMWEETALGAELDVWLSNKLPGGPNRSFEIAWRPWYWPGDKAVKRKYPIPVLTLEPHTLGAWAKFVAGSAQAQVSGYYFLPESPAGEDELTAGEDDLYLDDEALLEDEAGGAADADVPALFDRYWRYLSPGACELAGYLAVCPISLHVIALVQELVMGERARQLHVAELIYSGLLVPKTADEEAVSPDEVIYEFRGGAEMRALWLKTARRELALTIFQKISAYVDRRFGSGQGFRTLLYGGEKQENVALDDLGFALAEVAPAILRTLGGPHRELAEKLERRVWRYARRESGAGDRAVLVAASGEQRVVRADADKETQPEFSGFALLAGKESASGGLTRAMVANSVSYLAALLADPLGAGYAPEQVETVLGSGATPTALLAGAERLLEQLALNRDGTGLFYYAGSAVYQADTDDFLLLAEDGAETGLPLATLAARLQEAPFSRLLLLLDCAHAADIAERLYAAVDERRSKDPAGTGRALEIWCASKEPSPRYGEGLFSPFAAALIEAVGGGAARESAETVSTDELWHGVEKAMRGRDGGPLPVRFGQATFPAVAFGQNSALYRRDGFSPAHRLEVVDGPAEVTAVSSRPLDALLLPLEVRNNGLVAWAQGARLVQVGDPENGIDSGASAAPHAWLPPLAPGESVTVELELPLVAGITSTTLSLRPVLADGRHFGLTQAMRVRCVAVSGDDEDGEERFVVFSERQQGGQEISVPDGELIGGDLVFAGGGTIDLPTVVGQDLYVEGDLLVQAPLLVLHDANIAGQLILNAPLCAVHDLNLSGDLLAYAPLAVLGDLSLRGNGYHAGLYVLQDLNLSGALRAIRRYHPVDPEEAAARLAELPVTRLPAPGQLPENAYFTLEWDPLFTGREGELQQMAKAVKISAEGGIDAVLSGEAGIGKTKLAAEFVHRYGQFFPGGVFWINCHNPEVIASEIVRCGGQEGLALEGFELLAFEDQLQRVQGEWQGEIPRLLIFDNCRALAEIEQYLPATGGCRVLLTTRDRSLLDVAETLSLELRGLAPSEGVALLQKVMPEASEAEAMRLVKLVEGHPHSLSLIGNYLARSGEHISVEDYVARFEAAARESRGEREGGAGDVTLHQRAAFAVSWAQLCGPEGQLRYGGRVLVQMGQFAPDVPLATGLLERALALGGEQAAGGAREPSAQESRLEEALVLLADLGLIERQPRAASALVQGQTAALVQASAQEEAWPARQAAEAAVQDELARKLRLAGSGRVQLRRWREQIQYVTDRAAARGDGRALVLCAGFSRYLAAEGLYEPALYYLQRALAILRAGEAAPQLEADILNEAGSLLQLAARYEEAQDYLEQALKMREGALGPESVEVADTLLNLGILAQTQGEFQNARALYERALAIRERQLGTEHAATAQALNNLGLVSQAMGRYREAASFLERALAIREVAFGRDHAETAESVSNLGGLYQAQGNLDAARQNYERALKIVERTFGPDHLATAEALINLGRNERLRGAPLAARNLFERALAVRERLLGEHHPGVAQALDNLAQVYEALGEYERALSLSQRSLAILRQAFGEEHPGVAAALNNLAGIYETLGRYEEALPLYQRSLAIGETVYGANHPETATKLNNLARLYTSMQRFEEARPLYERSLRIRTEMLGEGHPDTATSLNNLGTLYRDSGQFEEARKLYAEALAIRRRALGDEHPDTATTIDNLAGVYRALGEEEQALDLYQQALAIRRAVLGETHPDTAVTMHGLGRVYHLQGDLERALPLYERSLAIFRDSLGADHPDTVKVRDQLAQLERQRRGAARGDRRFENGYALLVGVDESNVQRLALPTVGQDVRALYEVLIHPARCAYPPENVRLVRGAEATHSGILDGLYWLQEKVAADPEATVLLYYAGHGLYDEAGRQYYLVPYDIRSLARIRADAIRAEVFAAEVAEVEAQRMFVLLDCAHSSGLSAKMGGIFDERPDLKPISFPTGSVVTEAAPPAEEESEEADRPVGRDAKPRTEEVSEELALGAGRAILTSSTGAQPSYVRRDGQMSLFAYHLIEALTGFAGQDEEADVILVTDVMSYVARQVAQSATAEGRQQTPVMRTSGVFPVALLLGGTGTKAVDRLPGPLEPLPPAPGIDASFYQEGQTVGGQQVNIGEMEGNIGQIGDAIDTGGGAFVGRDVKTGGGDFTGRDRVYGDSLNVDTSGGAFVGGDRFVHGDQVQGDKVGGDKPVSGSASGTETARLFAPLLEQVGSNVEAREVVMQLQKEVAKGEEADDEQLAMLIEDLAEMAPAVVEALVALFTSSAVAAAAGGITRFVLGRLRRGS